MSSDGVLPELAEVEALIAQAETELAVLRRPLEREGRFPDPSDPFDPAGCLEIWLRALRERRDDLLRRTVRPGAGHPGEGRARRWLRSTLTCAPRQAVRHGAG